MHSLVSPLSHLHIFSDDWSSIPPYLPPTVLRMFCLFFTTTLVATIIVQMNLYARQVLGDEADTKLIVQAVDRQERKQEYKTVF